MITLRRFLSNWQNLFALAIIACYVYVAVAAARIAPPSDLEEPTLFRVIPDVRASALYVPRPPGPTAPLGTASRGFDIFYSLVWGTRPVLRFGLVTVLTTASFGVLIGAISGYFGGSLNRLVLRITDAFLTFPAIAGIFLFGQILTPADPEAPLNLLQRAVSVLGLDPVMLALIVFSWMPYARIINANMIKLKQTEYALAAQTIGATPLRIILRHLLPNAIAPAIVLAARDVGGMVILEAAFNFIGVGSGLPWGVLMVSSRDWVIGPGGNPLTYWWVYVPTTLALILFSIGWNLLGDGLNTVLDPRTARATHKLW
jgi:peptide/nickel transport system permease protein